MDEQDVTRHAESPIITLVDSAWGLIANAYGGDWELASQEWQDAAARWRDNYHSDAQIHPIREPV